MAEDAPGNPIARLLVANRGEIAIRILRAADEAGMAAVAVYAEDDADSLHARAAPTAHQLTGTGPAAYLDVDGIVAAAKATGCDAVHPGYGFLSEDPTLAERCAEAGIRFVGPRPEVLRLFGDKAAGRALAERCGVPILRGSAGAIDIDDAAAFLSGLGPGGAMMIKAVAGGGGRGMREVRSPDELDAAWERCRSEALSAFGNGDLLVEELAQHARHVEVQILGDGTGEVSHAGERECSLQRRNQKIIESAPAVGLDPAVRADLLAAAVTMAREISYDGIGTFEFLVHDEGFAFIEANPRLQVEHTVTEEVTGLDLVRISLDLGAGASLAQLGLLQDDVPVARGVAIQARVNMESLAADGTVQPSGGVLEVFEPPTGPGVRVDTFGYNGYRTNPRYDSLLAKIVARADSMASAVARACRALDDLRVDGVTTNARFLAAVLRHPDVVAGRVTTRFVEEHLTELLEAAPAADRPAAAVDPASVVAPLQGLVIELLVAVGDLVGRGTEIAVLESMKMQHVVRASSTGVVRHVAATVGDTVGEGELLVAIEPEDVYVEVAAEDRTVDIADIPPRLEALLEHRAKGLDENRPEAVARRHANGGRTAYENVADLCDDGSFVEYGALVVAAQRQRRTPEELIRKTPHDGVVTGTGRVNGERCVVVAYDYTVLAGTQGHWGHKKVDRMLKLAHEWRMPVILFAEGGGGRAGDTDPIGVSYLDTPSFRLLGRLSGLVPLVGITNGFCFAGNAVLLGSCDVIIATKDSNIGIGGPSMVEAAGLGSFSAKELGPHDVHVLNGVIDISAADEAEAVALAKRYLSCFQGPQADWTCDDQRLLRHILPENWRRVYEVRSVIETLADTGSVVELRPEFGRTMVSALCRIEGRPVGVLANDPKHLGGAVDTDGSDKAARFMQLCEAFRLPVVALCDTPGIMVGPEAENSGLVRHASRAIVIGANLTVPLVTIVLRKGYGIGAQVMAGGHFGAPLFTVSWPGGEFGPMGHEGTITLSHGAELEAIEDLDERARIYNELVAELYEESGAIGVATVWELDDVIDPAESRTWIRAALEAAEQRRPDKALAYIDTW